MLEFLLTVSEKHFVDEESTSALKPQDGPKLLPVHIKPLEITPG